MVSEFSKDTGVRKSSFQRRRWFFFLKSIMTEILCLIPSLGGSKIITFSATRVIECLSSQKSQGTCAREYSEFVTLKECINLCQVEA